MDTLRKIFMHTVSVIIHMQVCKHAFLSSHVCVLPDVSVLVVRGHTRTIWAWAGVTKVTKERVSARTGSSIVNSSMEVTK